MIGGFFVLIDCLRVLYFPRYFLFDFISWKGRWGSLWLSLDTVSLRTWDLLMDPHSLDVQCDQNNSNLTGLLYKISNLTWCNPPDLIRFNWSSIVHSLEFQILPQIGLSFAFPGQPWCCAFWLFLNCVRIWTPPHSLSCSCQFCNGFPSEEKGREGKLRGDRERD